MFCADVDECSVALDSQETTSVCPGGLSKCVNTQGSYACVDDVRTPSSSSSSTSSSSATSSSSSSYATQRATTGNNKWAIRNATTFPTSSSSSTYYSTSSVAVGGRNSKVCRRGFRYEAADDECVGKRLMCGSMIA